MDQLFDNSGMPMQGPFDEPFGLPLADPLRDPLRDQLLALENSIAPVPLPGERQLPGLAEGMDCLGDMLGQLEASIEAPAFSSPASSPAEPSMPTPAVAPPEDPGQKAISVQPPSPPPPKPAWFPDRRWGDLKPPAAATPFFPHAGLKAPSYHPLGGSGTGIRNTDAQEFTRWCPEANQSVNQAGCRACSQWDDHGSGFQQCYHDWLEENQDQDSNRHHEKDEENT